MNPVLSDLFPRISKCFRTLQSKTVSVRKYFTLLELLIVVAIIAILVAMLLPALNSVRDKAGQASCLGNMRQLSQSLFFYADDFNRYIPCYTTFADSGVHLDKFADYAKLPKAKSGTFAPKNSVFRCPEMPDDIYFGTPSNIYFRTSYTPNTILTGFRLRHFRRPSMVAIWVENGGYHETRPANTGSTDALAFRHNKGMGCNVAFSDGSVSYRKKTTVPCAETFPSDIGNNSNRPRGTWFWDDASDGTKRCGDL